ncbi:sigma-70 family RNA polymerase sigma factor [Octadecabacter arcticus]|uniref:sigma-70 family RNA polymerase sigma factor n=1 Tax=Octadecabacter arcticus TaxID=53946 RepID=UPI0001809FEF|nr:sigma-70 family RNA polymerase sigma factor [Octadecabacter arcticus]
MAEINLNADIDGCLSVKELVDLIRGEEGLLDQIISTSRLHAIDGKGDTALHICAAQGRLLFCDRLINAGSDPSLANHYGQRAHDRARENGHEAVAALLESLLPNSLSIEAETEAIRAPREDVLKQKNSIIFKKATAVSIEVESSVDDDFDWEFESEEEATVFHASQLIEDYDDESFLFGGRVDSLGDEDGAEFDFDQDAFRRFSIQGEDIGKVAVPTAQNAEVSTFRSFLEGQRSRGPNQQALTFTTRHFAVALTDVENWVNELLQTGRCDAEMIDELVSNVRGSFSYDVLFANVSREMAALGLLQGDEGQALFDELWVGRGAIDSSDIIDLLTAVLSGNNMKPGVEAFTLTRGAEERLFDRIGECNREICSVLISHELLLSVAVTLGEQMSRGELKQEVISELDIHPMRQTEDGEVLSESLSYLTAYHALLEVGDATSGDRNGAEDAIASMKLSSFAVELICKEIEGSAVLEVARMKLQESVSLRRSLIEAASISQLTQLRRLATRFPTEGLEEDDLFQEGYFGLTRSVEMFHAGRGNRLTTYSQYRIRQTIARAVDDHRSVVRIPVHFASKVRLIERFGERVSGNISRSDYHCALGKAFQIELAEIQKIENIPRLSIEFDENLYSDADIELEPFQRVLEQQRQAIIKDFLEDLPERHADIIVRRFGLDGNDEMTLEQCGQVYGVTRERIRQLEAKAIDWLRHPVRAKFLRELL